MFWGFLFFGAVGRWMLGCGFGVTGLFFEIGGFVCCRLRWGGVGLMLLGVFFVGVVVFCVAGNMCVGWILFGVFCCLWGGLYCEVVVYATNSRLFLCGVVGVDGFCCFSGVFSSCLLFGGIWLLGLVVCCSVGWLWFWFCLSFCWVVGGDIVVVWLCGVGGNWCWLWAAPRVLPRVVACLGVRDCKFCFWCWYFVGLW